MNAVWLTIAVLFLGTVAIKAAGPLALGGRPPGERFLAVIALVAPALLAALVTYETLTAGTRGIEIDARLVGLAAAAVAAALKLPLLVIVVLAAVGTALTRALA